MCRLEAAQQLLSTLMAMPLEPAAPISPNDSMADADTVSIQMLLEAAAVEMNDAAALATVAGHAAADASAAAAEVERLQRCSYGTHS